MGQRLCCRAFCMAVFWDGYFCSWWCLNPNWNSNSNYWRTGCHWWALLAVCHESFAVKVRCTVRLKMLAANLFMFECVGPSLEARATTFWGQLIAHSHFSHAQKLASGAVVATRLPQWETNHTLATFESQRHSSRALRRGGFPMYR